MLFNASSAFFNALLSSFIDTLRGHVGFKDGLGSGRSAGNFGQVASGFLALLDKVLGVDASWLNTSSAGHASR